MVIGFDTGFFGRMLNRDRKARDVWVSDEHERLVVPVVVLGELLYKGYSRGKAEWAKKFVSSIKASADVICPDVETIEKAAGIKASSSMGYIDAIVLATCIQQGCKEIHTTDRSDFKKYQNSNIKVVFWERSELFH